MSAVCEFLKGLKKAELQTIHQFWLPGESVQAKAEVLRTRVGSALRKGVGIEERVARLSQSQRRLIVTVLGRAAPRAPLADLQEALALGGASRIEVEATLRQLVERGFISRNKKKDRAKPEVLEIPDELAGHLARVLEVGGEPTSAADVISQKRLPFEIDFESGTIEERIDQLTDPVLVKLCHQTLKKRGIFDLESQSALDVLEDAGIEDPDLASWRTLLEDAGIGTIGSISLQDFGISIPDPALVIFQEWIQIRAKARLNDVTEPDSIIEAGVDLFIDLERFSLQVEQNPIRLTRSGSFPKRLAEQCRQGMLLERLDTILEGDSVTSVLRVALRLGIIENFAGELRVNSDSLASWRNLEFRRKVEVLLQRFLEESAGERWSFHQEALRGILMDAMRATKGDRWCSLEGLIDHCVGTYMLELEEREVASSLRLRREEDFAQKRLQSPFHRLGTDLAYWIVNRLLCLGLCEIGQIDGSLAAFRLTSLGHDQLGHPCEAGECRILVNPDFEIMLFTGGVDGMCLELQLARFCERLSAERVRRFRATPESMRFGIRSGLAIDEIRKVLEDASDHPLPETVAVSIRDWGRDMDWVQARPAIIFGGLRPDRCKSLRELLDQEKVKHVELGRGEILIPGSTLQSADGSNPRFIDRLREEGWLVRIEEDSALRLKSPSKESQ